MNTVANSQIKDNRLLEIMVSKLLENLIAKELDCLRLEYWKT